MSELIAKLRILGEQVRGGSVESVQEIVDLWKGAQIGPERVAIIEAELRDGNLRVLDTDSFISDMEVRERARWIPAILAPHFLAKNFDLCAPSLERAISGETDVRTSYERNRLLSIHSLPAWAQRVALNDTVTSKSFTYDRSNLPAEIRLRVSQLRLPVKLSTSINSTPDSNLNVAFTFKAHQTSIEAISLVQELFGLMPDLVNSGIEKEIVTGLPDLSLPTPYSMAVISVWKRFSARLLITRILEDVRELEALPVDDSYLSRIARSVEDPWEVLQHPLLEKARLVKELCAEQPHLGVRAGMLLLSKDPRARAKDLVILPPTTAGTDSEPTRVDPGNQLTTRDSIRLGLRAALQVYDPECLNLRDTSRLLAKLIAGSPRWYADVIDKFAGGVRASDIINELRGRRRAEKNSWDDQSGEGPDIETPHSRAPAQASLAVMASGAAIRQQIYDLPHELRRSVELRIERATDRNFGDHGAIRSGLMEMRIHARQGVRIYFSRLTPDSILIHRIGYKADQDRDIQKCLADLNEAKMPIPLL